MVVECEYYDAYTKYIPSKHNNENQVVNRLEKKKTFRRPVQNWQNNSNMCLMDQNERWIELDKDRVQYQDLVTVLEEIQSWVFGPSGHHQSEILKYSPHDLK